MTQPVRPASPEPSRVSREQWQRAATGISVAAAVVLLAVSALSILEATVALTADDFYAAHADYLYDFDQTTWGWVHLVLGVVAFVCAAGLLFGTTWGRYGAVAIAALVIIANFLSLPYYPAWSLTVIALSVVVVSAVLTWHSHA